MQNLRGLLSDPLFLGGLNVMTEASKNNPNYGDGIIGALSGAQQYRDKFKQQDQLEQERAQQQGFLNSFQNGLNQSTEEDEMTRVAKALIGSGNPKFAIQGAQLLRSTQGRGKTGFAPQVVMGPDGEPVYAQFDNQGGLKILDGVSPMQQPVIKDTGNKIQARNPLTGAVLWEQDKTHTPNQDPNLKYSQSHATTTGKNDANAEVVAFEMDGRVGDALEQMSYIENLDGLKSAVGTGAEAAKIFARGGTDLAEFNAQLGNLQDQLYMIARGELKGQGSITEQEAAAAANSITSLFDTKMPIDAWMAEFNRLKQKLVRFKMRARKKARLGDRYRPESSSAQTSQPNNNRSLDDLLDQYGG